MPTYSRPGVFVEEMPSTPHPIEGASTATTLFAGWASRGPVERAMPVHGFADYQRIFGGLDARTWLGHALKHYFDNGGKIAHVLRIVDATATTAGATLDGLQCAATSPGAWANDVRLQFATQADDATRGRLDVLQGAAGTIVETFENLSAVPGDPHYVETAINGRSAIVVVTATGPWPASAAASLADGNDGTVIGPGDAVFHAAVGAAFGPDTVTDRVEGVNLVCVPGLADATTIAALQHDCRRRRAFLIVDAPQAATTGTVAQALADITAADAVDSAFYFPWVNAPDPLQADAPRAFPPSGFVAGIYARTDLHRGVWKSPAGRDASLVGAIGPTLPVDLNTENTLAPRGINCLRTFPNVGLVLCGARTLAGSGSPWQYVSVRRLRLFIEESVVHGLQWAVFEANDEALWTRVRFATNAFLQTLHRQGALTGSTPRDASYVKCDSGTMTQADLDAGCLVVEIGFAPLKPAEFVIFRIRMATAGAS